LITTVVGGGDRLGWVGKGGHHNQGKKATRKKLNAFVSNPNKTTATKKKQRISPHAETRKWEETIEKPEGPPRG